jgi:hypothetical protein
MNKPLPDNDTIQAPKALNRIVSKSFKEGKVKAEIRLQPIMLNNPVSKTNTQSRSRTSTATRIKEPNLPKKVISEVKSTINST